MTAPGLLRIGVALLCTVAWFVGSRAHAGDPQSAAARDKARQILEATGVTGGLVVLVGCGDGGLAAGLRAGEGFLVQALDTDAASVEAARVNVRSLGLYGAVTADRFDRRRLPYVDNLVRLLVSEDLGGVPEDEALRVLAPLGVAFVRQDGEWRKRVKPWPKEIDPWTHYLHDAGNNAVAHDSVVGPPGGLQWSADPLYCRAGGVLWAVSALDGRKLAECRLEAPPVFDGLVAANGCLYLSLADSRVICLGGK